MSSSLPLRLLQGELFPTHEQLTWLGAAMCPDYRMRRGKDPIELVVPGFGKRRISAVRNEYRLPAWKPPGESYAVWIPEQIPDLIAVATKVDDPGDRLVLVVEFKHPFALPHLRQASKYESRFRCGDLTSCPVAVCFGLGEINDSAQMMLHQGWGALLFDGSPEPDVAGKWSRGIVHPGGGSSDDFFEGLLS
jgi:hypothetical protein